MHILQVALGFYPALAWGGPVKVVYQNAKELLRRGHQVTVCCSNLLDKSRHIAPGTFEDRVQGIRVVYLNTYALPGWHGTVGPTILSAEAVKRLYQEVKTADLIHANGSRNMIVLSSAVLARLLNKPFILQPHGTLPHILGSIRLKQLFDRTFGGLLVGKAAALLALQEAERQQILAAGGQASKIHLVPNGLDPAASSQQFQPNTFKTKYSIPPDHKVILFLARINRKKGADLLVRAFAQMENRHKISLVMAGPDDGQLAEVQALTETLNLTQQTVFTGLLDETGVSQAFAAADIFVLPCRKDTFPVAIMEACRNGTPVIVTDTCEIADKIAGIAGDVVPVDINILARTIETLLADKAKQARYAAGGQQLLETEFSIQAVGDNLETIYRNVLYGSAHIPQYAN